MVTVMMQIITLPVILMVGTVVDLVSIENIVQIVYVYLKNLILQVINSFFEMYTKHTFNSRVLGNLDKPMRVNSKFFLTKKLKISINEVKQSSCLIKWRVL